MKDVKSQSWKGRKQRDHGKGDMLKGCYPVGNRKSLKDFKKRT